MSLYGRHRINRRTRDEFDVGRGTGIARGVGKLGDVYKLATASAPSSVAIKCLSGELGARLHPDADDPRRAVDPVGPPVRMEDEFSRGA